MTKMKLKNFILLQILSLAHCFKQTNARSNRNVQTRNRSKHWNIHQNIYIDGLVHISNLPNDYYDFDSVSHRLVGKRSSRIYSLGDRVNVAISRVDMDDRQIDLELVK